MTMTELSVEIVDIALPDSYGVGKQDNYVFFVPGALTGDRVRIKVIKEGKRFSYGEIIEIERPSPLRCEAGCSHFGSCGGCTLQHLAYEKQLEVKGNYLLQTLVRIGGVDVSSVEITPVVPSPEQYSTRNKVEMSFGSQRGKVVVGLRERVAPGANYEGKVIPLSECPTFSGIAEKILPHFTAFSNTHRLLPYNPVRKNGFLRHLVLRESKTSGEIMVILETTPGALPDLTGLWQDLSKHVPQVKSLYRATNSRATDTGLYEGETHLFGDRFIQESMGGLTFRIYPQSFFQPNTRVAQILYRTIVDLLEPDPRDRVLGLYCGMGPIELFLSPKVKEVTGVDSNPANIANAKENCRINGIENCAFIEGRVEKVRDRFPSKPDVLIIDPPRGGISADGLNIIVRTEPARIVYVSCNPSTLARDLRFLKGHGYEPGKIASFDAFPHTGHLEALALIEKRPRPL